MEVSAPKSVLYGDQLPLGLEAKATKKLFFPTTGETYTPSGNKTIRIDVNYDGMLDTQQSFLQFKLQNKSGAGRVASFDLGQSLIKKLTISSGGVVLEEIQDYNSLYANVLLPAQGGPQTLQYERNNQTGIDFDRNTLTIPSAADNATDTIASRPAASVDGDMAVVIGDTSAGNEAANIRTAILQAVNNLSRTKLIAADGSGSLKDFADDNNARFQNAAGGAGAQKLFYSGAATAGTASTFTGAIADDGVVVVNYKLVSGLLDNDKYLPLVLMNAGITIEIELASALECMVGVGGAGNVDYSISECRYVGHTIDLQRDFYDRLRMVQQNSGGVLQIVGQSFRSFRGNLTATAGEQTVNCPARVRSIKSFFFHSKSTGGANVAAFDVSKAGTIGISEYQLSIGATRYPPTSNKFNAASNKNGAYTELMKAFGKVGSTTHNDLMGSSGYIAADGTAANCGIGDQVSFCPFGIDLESFRHQIENGIDTSSRALPISLHLNCNPATPQDLFMYVLYDTIFYINMDGSVSVSS